MEAREVKGLEMAFQSKIEWTGKHFLVPSQTSKGRYRVDADASFCTCEDFELHAKPCKHIHAVRVIKEMNRSTKVEQQKLHDAYADAVVPPKKTYKQDWKNYNKAQTNEKRLFCELLSDLCRTVPEPKRKKTGRPSIPLADAIFAAAYKVYSTVSGRRFTCDLQDARERGFIGHAPHYNSIFRVFEDAETTPVLIDLIERSSIPLASIETSFAVDSTGFSTNRFEKWFNKKYGETRERAEWVKCHVITGVRTNIVTAVAIGDEHDSQHFAPLVKATKQNFEVKEVSADKAYISRANLELVEELGGKPFIPFKVNAVADKNGETWRRLFHEFNLNRDAFNERYHQRSNVESTFSMMKAKFRDHVRSKTDEAMVNEVLAKVLCHNVVVCIHEMFALGIAVEFGGDEKAEDLAETDEPRILRFPGA